MLQGTHPKEQIPFCHVIRCVTSQEIRRHLRNPKVGYGCTRVVHHQDCEWYFQQCRFFMMEVCQTARLEDQLLLPAHDFYSTHLQLPFLSRGCSILSPLSYDITYSVEKASLNRLGSGLKSRGIRIQFPAGQNDFFCFPNCPDHLRGRWRFQFKWH
jgi:hypothetical protein